MTTYTIGQTAVIVGKPNEPLPTNTIRNWTKQYASFLGPDANPPAGIERRYTPADVAVLRRVHELRNDRLVYADIAADLTAHRPVAVEVVTEEVEEVQPDVAAAPIQPVQDAPGTALAVPVVLDDLLTRIARIEATNATAPQQQRKLAVWVAVLVGVAIIAGVIVGAVLVTVLR